MCVCAFFLSLSALNALSRCVIFRQGVLCVCSFYFCPKCIVTMCLFQQCTCQDASSFGRGSCVCVCAFFLFLSALNALSRCVVFRQGVLCVCVCLCVCVFLFISALNALSRCVVFWQCTCQDVSSFGRGSCVCVYSSYFYPKCIVKMCRLSAEGLVCVCVLSFYFCPKCIVKMCRLSAMHLSRCVVFRQGVFYVCVRSFFFFLP